jgi:hypothetical protein
LNFFKKGQTPKSLPAIPISALWVGAIYYDGQEKIADAASSLQLLYQKILNL